PATMRAVVPFAGHAPPPLPIVGMATVAQAPAPASDAEAPGLEEVERRGHSVRMQLHSRRGAHMLGVLVPGGVTVRAAGRAIPSLPSSGPSRFAGHDFVLLRGGVTGGAAELMLLGVTERTPEIFVFDISRELPPAAAQLAAVRGRRGVPSQEGDLSIVMRKI